MPNNVKTLQNGTKLNLKESRYKSAPKKLAMLIALSNEVHGHSALPSIEELRTKVDELGVDFAKKDDSELVLEYAKQLSDQVWTYLLIGDFEPRNPEDVLRDVKEGDVGEGYLSFTNELSNRNLREGGVVGRYLSFAKAHDRLRLLAEEFSTRDLKPEATISIRDTNPVHWFQMWIDENGEICTNKDLFTDAVEGVEAARIRLCEVCRNVFWASRMNKKSCSKLCAHALRNRRYRERYSQGFNQEAKPSPKEKRELEAKRKTSTKKGK